MWRHTSGPYGADLVPEVRLVKWVIDGSKEPREVGPCWVTG